MRASPAVALLAAAALAAAAVVAEAQEWPDPWLLGQLQPSGAGFLTVDRVSMIELLASARDYFYSLAENAPDNVVAKREPECRGMPSTLTVPQLYEGLGSAMDGAVKAIESGDVDGYRRAKASAYRLVSCYSRWIPESSLAMAMRLVASEPIDDGMEHFLVYIGVLMGPAPQPRPPQSPSVPEPTQPPPSAPGGGGVNPPAGSGQSGSSGLESPPGVEDGRVFDVEKLISMLESIRAVSSSAPGSASMPALPSVPAFDERLVAAALAAAAVYAARGRLGSAAMGAVRALRHVLARTPRIVDARRCYRIALARAESLGARAKRPEETPSEYLAAAARMIGPIQAAALERVTRAYEEHVYAGRERVLPRSVCMLEEV